MIINTINYTNNDDHGDNMIGIILDFYLFQSTDMKMITTIIILYKLTLNNNINLTFCHHGT